ncbi:hypothetical protein [Granulicella tundricola]|uniref:Uncharacterized protein n=1 Tax=Granulicella tundricola (strain ATCC BAA-1859 / DSM 23138 / MP5ACTX9) TaxID=1198114 RepID=E8X146_GRATM|nr:hypothetical protein [Granulicella tundricola]ADW67912.1 hypothetical protein AciX9_0844 [Granulicella tundricola MP5ACTX9]
MSKLFLLLLLSVSPQSAQLSGPIALNDPTLVQAAKEARKAGWHDVMTYPKQSFVVSWNGARLGTFLSLGARSAGASYQCLHSFVPDDGSVASSTVVTAGAGKLGTDICDHPSAVGILPSPPDQIRVGILYANSDYSGGNKDAGADAPSVSAAVVIDPGTRRMTLDVRATEILQRAGPSSLQAMRGLF